MLTLEEIETTMFQEKKRQQLDTCQLPVQLLTPRIILGTPHIIPGVPQHVPQQIKTMVRKHYTELNIYEKNKISNLRESSIVKQSEYEAVFQKKIIESNSIISEQVESLVKTVELLSVNIEKSNKRISNLEAELKHVKLTSYKTYKR